MDRSQGGLCVVDILEGPSTSTRTRLDTRIELAMYATRQNLDSNIPDMSTYEGCSDPE
jgi:hypothetical protein